MKRSLIAMMALVLMLALVRADTPNRKEATIEYVRGLQTASGAWKLDAKAEAAGVRPTSSALRALRYFGGEAKDLNAARDYVKRCFDRSVGGFADRPEGNPSVFPTAIGIMAVVEVKLPTEPYADAVAAYLGKNAKTFEEIRIAAAGLEAIGKRPLQAKEWLELIDKMRNDDGSYGKGDDLARTTGGAAVAVLRLGGKVDRAGVLRVLKAGQRRDGGWGKAGTDKSDLETSYRVMRAFHMLKAKPDVEPLRQFIARCRNKDGGYGVQPGAPSSVSGCYFAGIILHWLS